MSQPTEKAVAAALALVDTQFKDEGEWNRATIAITPHKLGPGEICSECAARILAAEVRRLRAVLTSIVKESSLSEEEKVAISSFIK